jgi:uncharacterized protein
MWNRLDRNYSALETSAPASLAPHYTTFATESGGRYMFDGPTGAVIPTNELLAEAVKLYATHSLEEVRERLKGRYAHDEVDGVLDFVARWDEHFLGFYRREEESARSLISMCKSRDDAVQKRADHCDESDLKELRLRAGMPAQMILQVTENCPVRCKYCIFSETYDYTRNRTSLRMSPQVAIKAVDYFFDLLRPIGRKIPGKTASLSFYGGEPLLEMGLIKLVVGYVQALAPVPVSFGVVTSFTVLTDEAIDFLVSNNVKVCVSLDGHKEDHDRNRILPNGKGTFDLVYKNIKRFQNRHPTYRNLYILSAYDCKTDLERNIAFFEENDLPPILFVSPVRGENTDYWDQFSNEDRNRFQESLRRTAAKYVELRKQGRRVPEYLAALYDMFAGEVLLRTRPGDDPSIFPPHTSQCIPGMKLQVRADGTLDICERMNFSFPIGDLATGLNDGAIRNIQSSYNSTVAVGSDCSQCVFNRNCSLCFATCCKDGSFQRQDDWCDSFRHKYLSNLIGTYSILEANASAFDFFYTWSEDMDRKKSLLYRCNRSQLAPLKLTHTIRPR